MAQTQDRLVFLDLETMGLRPTASIVQVGIVIARLNGRAFESQASWSHTVPRSAREWATAEPGAASMHAQSGLREASERAYAASVRDQDQRPVLTVASEEAIRFLSEQGFGPQQAMIAGTSVGVDRVWLAVQMPHLHDYLHYRMVDVSALRTLRGMLGQTVERAEKAHTAIADCEAAISELNLHLRSLA